MCLVTSLPSVGVLHSLRGVRGNRQTAPSSLTTPQAEQEKKAAIIMADGEATAAKMLAKAFGDAGEGLVELRRIEAAEAIAAK